MSNHVWYNLVSTICRLHHLSHLQMNLQRTTFDHEGCSCTRICYCWSQHTFLMEIS